MKILHLTYSFNNGGKENLIVDIANQQAADGHAVQIIVINARFDASVIERIKKPVAFLILGKNQNPFWPVYFLYVLLRFRPDVVHCHDQSMGKWVRLFTRSVLCVTVHGTEVNIALLKYYHKVFAISHAVQKEIAQVGIANSILIQNGIRASAITRKQSWKPATVCRIVQVGNLLHSYKGQDVSIKAIDRLVNQKKIAVTLDLVGEGDSREFLQELAEKINVTHAVSFLGSKSRSWIYENLHTYDIMVQPARNEGFGLTIVEGLIAGLPVIAVDKHGPHEILANGKFGYLIENENDAQLADTITAVLSAEPADLQKKLNEAQDHCMRSFDVTRTAREYVKYYS